MTDVELKRKVTLKIKKGDIVVVVCVKKCSDSDSAPSGTTVEQPPITTPREPKNATVETEEVSTDVADDKGTIPQAETTPASTPEQGSNQPAVNPITNNSVSGSIEEKAKRTIRGDFGNGVDRKQILGDEYNEIQQKVNEMYRHGDVIN